MKSGLSLKNIELNHRQVWKLIILWNIIYRGKCKPCSKYLPANMDHNPLEMRDKYICVCVFVPIISSKVFIPIIKQKLYILTIFN